MDTLRIDLGTPPELDAMRARLARTIAKRPAVQTEMDAIRADLARLEDERSNLDVRIARVKTEVLDVLVAETVMAELAAGDTPPSPPASREEKRPVLR